MAGSRGQQLDGQADDMMKIMEQLDESSIGALRNSKEGDLTQSIYIDENYGGNDSRQYYEDFEQ